MTACVYSLLIGVISQSSPYTKAGTWLLAVSKPPPQAGCRTSLLLVPPPDPLLPDLGISRGGCCLTSPLGSRKASSVWGRCPHSPQQDWFQGHLYPEAQPSPSELFKAAAWHAPLAILVGRPPPGVVDRPVSPALLRWKKLSSSKST